MIKLGRMLTPIVWVLLTACMAAKERVGAYECKELARFFSQPVKLQREAFDRFDPGKKYAIYICGNQYMHPPMLHLAELFARDGHTIAEMLREKLLASTDDLTVRDITALFEAMQKQGSFDVTTDGNLNDLLHSKVSRMVNPGWKELTEGMLKKLDSIGGQTNKTRTAND